MLCRYFPAGVDVDAVRQERQRVVANMRRQTHPHLSDAQRDQNNKWRVSRDSGCKCCQNRTPLDRSAVGCPVKAFGKADRVFSNGHTPPGFGEHRLSEPDWSMLQSMRSRAVYMPWVKEGYRCYPIHMAAAAGDTVLATECVKATESPLQAVKDTAGNTPLIIACGSQSSKALVKVLLKSCADSVARQSLVQVINKENLTALHVAALNARFDLVKLLLKNGADPNAGTVELSGFLCGLTPLHLAITVKTDFKARLRCVRYLLKKHADPNIQALSPRTQGSGATPLMYYECFCGGCWSRRVGTLSSLAPPILLKDNDSSSKKMVGGLIHLAIQLGWNKRHVFQMWQWCRGKLNPELEDGKGETVLGLSARLLFSDLVTNFIRRGVRVDNASTVLGEVKSLTPVHVTLAQSLNYYKRVVDCTYCSTPVRFSQDMETEMVKVADQLLKQRPCQLESRDSLGRTPLLIAVQFKHVLGCKKLLERGANLLAVDNKGKSPLHKVCEWPVGQEKKDVMLDLLIKHGAVPPMAAESVLSDTSPLKAVLHNQDCTTLRKLYWAGGVSAMNLSRMLDCLNEEPEPDEPDEEVDEFRKTVLYMLGNCPRSLEDLCLYAVSTCIPMGPPKQRREKLQQLPLSHLQPRFVGLGLFEKEKKKKRK